MVGLSCRRGSEKRPNQQYHPISAVEIWLRAIDLVLSEHLDGIADPLELAAVKAQRQPIIISLHNVVVTVDRVLYQVLHMIVLQVPVELPIGERVLIRHVICQPVEIDHTPAAEE